MLTYYPMLHLPISQQFDQLLPGSHLYLMCLRNIQMFLY